MSNKGSGNQTANDGYTVYKKGYKPIGGNVTGGHKPAKSIQKPINPPKKK